MMAKYKRGFTAKSLHPADERPPKLQGRVYNDFYPDKARSAVMPPPTGDTQEPRLSKRVGAKGLARGRKR
jgi:hypothetical protein